MLQITHAGWQGQRTQRRADAHLTCPADECSEFTSLNTSAVVEPGYTNAESLVLLEGEDKS